MTPIRLYESQIRFFRERLEEISLELDAIHEILANKYESFDSAPSSVATYLEFRQSKLQTERKQILNTINELQKEIAAQKRFDKYGILITEEQEKIVGK